LLFSAHGNETASPYIARESSCRRALEASHWSPYLSSLLGDFYPPLRSPRDSYPLRNRAFTKIPTDRQTHRFNLDDMPEQPSAGPSRPPQVQPIRSPTRSRSLASLLKGKEASSNDSSLLSPVSPTSSASMRRAASHEDAPGLPAEVPPLPPPKTATGKPLTDPLLHAARAKMSSQDQEAMRKLRSTMVELSEEGSTKSPTASTSASTSNSPNSAMFPSIATSASSHHLRSRRSTLSRLVVPEEETPSANPVRIYSVTLRRTLD